MIPLIKFSPDNLFPQETEFFEIVNGSDII